MGIKEDRQRAKLEAKRAKDKSLKELLDRFGLDDFSEGDVIRWTKTFANSDYEYSYCAVKMDEKWYTSNGKTLRWSELLYEAMEDNTSELKIEVASAWSKTHS